MNGGKIQFGIESEVTTFGIAFEQFEFDVSTQGCKK
jgi:hypothetical protein